MVFAVLHHPYGLLCLLPPVATILLAIATRRIVLSLLIGIYGGALITTGGHPWRALCELLEIHLWKTLVDESRLRVFAFTLLMGAMVGVIHASGGMQGLVLVVERWANSRRRGQLVAWTLGMLIFFDDYANTVLLGTTLRPLTDRLRISREKLAFLVDSTAAPVAGLAVVSTWVAGEVSYVQDGLNKVAGGETVNAFQLFIATLPYRFYLLWTLLFVFFVAWLDRDFGPMLRAERRARQGTPADIPVPDAAPDHQADRRGTGHLAMARPELPARMPRSHDPHLWYLAVVPVLLTVGSVLGMLYASGMQEVNDPQAAWSQIFGAADSYYALVWSSLAGLVCAAALAWGCGALDRFEIGRSARGGAELMLPSLIILWLASTLSNMTGNKTYTGAAAPTYSLEYRLYTGEYCGEQLTARPEWSNALRRLAPTVIFVLASFVSFATGTSWGTMAIVMPMAIPLVFGLLPSRGVASAFADPIMLGSMGSVLAGAIFGDHCSPISDTTILSSQSSGCDHLAHVWTQLPYAATVAGITILVGTLPVGLGVPVGILLPCGALALWGIVRLAGRQE